VWSRENRDIIFKKFSPLVAEQRAPLADVESILSADPDLIKKLENDLKISGKNLLRCVRDKIRSFYRSKYGYKQH